MSKYNIGDTVYWLEDYTDFGGEGPFFKPIKCRVTDAFTASDGETYYQLKSIDDIFDFVTPDDEIPEVDIYTTYEEADKAWRKIEVYEFCDCDLVVTNKSLKETIEWYKSNFQEVDETEVKLININDKIKSEMISGWENIKIKDYIADIRVADMPLVFASTEY